MRQRKPRTKEQSWRYQNKKCPYYDGVNSSGEHMHECMNPWNTRCEGNIHKCFKLKLQWLASLSDKKRKTEQEKYSS